MKQRGFTLIELLVVIAIIAILAAILFPVFAQAREAARTSTSLSNTKQVSTCMMMSLQAYDEQFPAWKYCDFCGCGGPTLPAKDSAAFWTMAIYPYVKNAAVYRCPNDNYQLNDSWAGCSDDGGKHDMFGPYDPSTGKSPNPNYVSYGFSEFLTNQRKLSAVNAPARELLFADSINQLVAVGPVGWWASKPDSIVARTAFANDDGNVVNEGNTWNLSWTAADFLNHFTANKLESVTRHHGGANISYVDGHAKYMRWSDMTFCRLTSDPSCPQ